MAAKMTEAEETKAAPVFAAFRTKAKAIFRQANGDGSLEAAARESLRKLLSASESELHELFGRDRAKAILEDLMARGKEIQRTVGE
jgi:hypothetical protein